MNYDKLYDKDINYIIKEQDILLLQEYFIKKRGWVYIAYSKNNHHLKIGRTSKNPLERAKTLSSTGVLHDYEILFSLPVFNQYIVEKMVHQKLKKYRVSKEFFSLNENVAIETLQKEYENEEYLLSRFFYLDLLKEDISLVQHAIKK